MMSQFRLISLEDVEVRDPVSSDVTSAQHCTNRSFSGIRFCLLVFGPLPRRAIFCLVAL